MDTMYQVYAVPGFAEPFSCWSHLLGVAIFLYLGWVLLRRGGVSTEQLLALSLYAFACVFLLLVSALYHLLPIDGEGRLLLRYIDHAAIYLLIASTFIAVHAILFEGVWRWGMIAVVSLAALFGIISKVMFFADIPEWVSLLFYLAFGWFGLVSGILLWRRYGLFFLRPLFYGGLAYTVGAVFEFIRQPILVAGVIGPHELFHVTVLIGMGYHWLFIYQSLHVDIRTASLRQP